MDKNGKLTELDVDSIKGSLVENTDKFQTQRRERKSEMGARSKVCIRERTLRSSGDIVLLICTIHMRTELVNEGEEVSSRTALNV